MLLEARDLHKHFPVRRGLRTRHMLRAVDGIDLALAAGDACGLVGESGSGKSTVARLILRLLQPTAGRILFEGADIAQLDERQVAPLRPRMQMIFQDPHSALNPRKTIFRSVAEPLIIHAGMRGGALDHRVRELLDIVGLTRSVPVPLPARALRRAETAGLHCSGGRPAAAPAGPGRADLGAGRLRAGADP